MVATLLSLKYASWNGDRSHKKYAKNLCELRDCVPFPIPAPVSNAKTVIAVHLVKRDPTWNYQFNRFREYVYLPYEARVYMALAIYTLVCANGKSSLSSLRLRSRLFRRV